MDFNKVLFVSQEISPYLPASTLATAGQFLPQRVQEAGYEVRTFMPKYGCINERRNQLHEVIRLSGVNIVIDDTDHPLIIKVATLQPARLQVYFIFNDDYFSRNICKGLETATAADENDERSIFFVRGVFETVKKLRWNPDIVHCAGWISALTTVYLKQYYNEDPSFRDAKVVYSIYDDDMPAALDARMGEKMKADGISDDTLKDIMGKPVDYKALTKLAIANCDGVISHCANLDPELEQFIKDSGKPFMLCTSGKDVDAQIYVDFYKSL
ncbi:MAG: glycogen/starch synthase [Bacteroidales bacterium]|nr:glycogen/starch synthase [Bacteroidales bacterium]